VNGQPTEVDHHFNMDGFIFSGMNLNKKNNILLFLEN